jgi:peptidoglycan/xylan/chitin deacetylase (PgdA/CDA1 family)
MKPVASLTRFGPNQLPSALVLTFDNLGEATELERRSWPADAPLGHHRSVTVVLPRLLEELDAHELTATFFVEAINCELYPEALLEIARRGHELGHHGWRHETWAELSVERERDTLTHGVRAFAALGQRPRGFRPPGGQLTTRSEQLLREADMHWCSPAGGPSRVHDGLAYVPFDWRFVDAYHLMQRFGKLRAKRGDPPPPRSPSTLAAWIGEQLELHASRGGQLTLVLHPFLMLEESWFAGVRELFRLIAAMARDGRTWVVSGERFAAWMEAA